MDIIVYGREIQIRGFASGGLVELVLIVLVQVHR